MPFYPLLYYKLLQPQGEQDKKYQNKIAITFLENKHNANTIRKEFPIEMYSEGLPHKPFFITLTLQDQLIIEPTKKMVALYMVGDLKLLN